MNCLLKIKPAGKLGLVAFCLLFSLNLVAQETQTTNKLLKKDKTKDDIEFLNSVYDIEKVSMDQVFYVESRDSSNSQQVKVRPTQLQGQQEVEVISIPMSNMGSNPAATSIPVQTQQTPPPPSVQVRSSSTTSRSSERSGNYPPYKAPKKMKMKRIRPHKSRSGGSSKGRCYSF